jgi:hypothetical protein
MPEPKEFRPLMESIHKVLQGLEGKDLPPGLERHVVEKLKTHFKEYSDCCCMDAQVVKGPAAK